MMLRIISAQWQEQPLGELPKLQRRSARCLKLTTCLYGRDFIGLAGAC